MRLSSSRLFAGSALAALTLCTFGLPASAQIVNPSFETDAVGSSSITGWQISGTADVTDASFGDNPTNGSKQAFLDNAPLDNNVTATPDLESFFGLTAGSLTGLGNGTVTNGSGLSQTFTVAKAGKLSFDYDFVTSEDPNPADRPFHDDFAFVSLTGGTSLLATLADSANTPIQEPPQTGRNSPSIDDYLSETGYKTYTTTLAPGTYTLGLGVVNVGSNDIGSGLLADNVQFTPTPVPETATSVSFALLLGLGSLLIVRRAKSGANS